MPCAMPSERAGIVLAGRPEGLDDSLIDATLSRLVAAGIQDRVVAGKQPEYEHVPDPSPGGGPLAAIQAVLQARPQWLGRTLVIVPVDMPSLNVRALQRLTEIGELDGRGAQFDLGPLPLVLCFTTALKEHLDDLLTTGGDRSLVALTRRLGLPTVASMPDDGLDNQMTSASRRTDNPS